MSNNQNQKDLEELQRRVNELQIKLEKKKSFTFQSKQTSCGDVCITIFCIIFCCPCFFILFIYGLCQANKLQKAIELSIKEMDHHQAKTEEHKLKNEQNKKNVEEKPPGAQIEIIDNNENIIVDNKVESIDKDQDKDKNYNLPEVELNKQENHNNV